MNPLNMLSGLKTYITAAVGIVAAVAALLGIEVPAVDPANAFTVIWAGLLAIFVRKGVNSGS